MMRCTLLALLAALSSSAHLHAKSHDVEMPPKGEERYKSAKFRICIPDGVKAIRGVIVRQHGCGRNGFDHSDDLQWQALAAKHSCALFGSHFVQNKECADWFDPKNGSERAFFDALAHFAKESNHPELVEAPWAIWGHSGGSLWACHMLNRHPHRIIAIWGRSQALTDYVDAALAVPVCFNYGEGEKTGRFESVHKNSTRAFETFRPKGALWSIAVDPKSGHDCRDSRTLAIPYFDELLTLRLPQEGNKLIALNVAKGTLVDPKTFEVVKTDTAEAKTAFWMPSEAVAKNWAEYGKTGVVKDTTPPPAPTMIDISHNSGGVTTIRWKCTADLESGIKEFVVYRNGEKFATVGGDKAGSNKNGYFQMWNYGDEPEPKLPKFEWTGKAAVEDKFEIAVVNHAGLESKKTGVK